MGSSSPSSGGATSAVQDRAQQAAGVAQEKAQQAAGQARGVVRQQVDQRSTQAGERISTVVSDARSVSDQLRSQGKEGPAKLVDQVAQRVEGVGDYLRDSDADRILNDIENFGRRQPWVVVGTGLIAGLAASRFLKASSTRRYESSRSTQRAYTPYTPATGTGAAGYPPATPVTPPPRIERTGADDLTEPLPSTPATNVSLSGGVLPGEDEPLGRPLGGDR